MIFTFKRFSLLACLINTCSISHACNNVSAASGETPTLYARGGCGPRPLRTREGPLGQTPIHASPGSDVFFERVWAPRTCRNLSGTTSHQQVDQSDQSVLEWRFFLGAFLAWGELVVNPYPHQRIVFFRMGQRDLTSTEDLSQTFLANLEFQPLAGTPQGAEAFQSLVSGAATSGYASVSPGPDSGPEFLRKGSVCPLVASEVSLPTVPDPPSTRPSRRQNSMRFTGKRRRRCCCRYTGVDWDAYRATPGYNDPALDDPLMRRQLVARLWQANMLEFIDQGPEEHIDIFTVIKKDSPPPPAGSGGESGLIWDVRRLNERCKPSPRMPMGSPTCSSFWDTSEALEEGSSCNPSSAICQIGFTAYCCPRVFESSLASDALRRI